MTYGPAPRRPGRWGAAVVVLLLLLLAWLYLWSFGAGRDRAGRAPVAVPVTPGG